MVLNMELMHRNIVKALLEEKKTPGGLNGDTLEVRLEVLTEDTGNMDAGAFGKYLKPISTAGRMRSCPRLK